MSNWIISPSRGDNKNVETTTQIIINQSNSKTYKGQIVTLMGMTVYEDCYDPQKSASKKSTSSLASFRVMLEKELLLLIILVV